MHLRSRVFYRLGNPVARENVSRISTEESTARTPGLKVQQAEENLPGYVSDSSMDTTSSYQSQPIGVELDYDGKLRFHMENTHGAKIYKDFIHRFAVKVEDHPSEVDPAPWVNFQGDRYMGQDGVMYLLTENPENVDRLGNVVQREERHVEENPPVTNRPGLRPINSIWVRRVLIDDPAKVLYKRVESRTEFFYLRNSFPDHTITEDKVLYTFIDTNQGAYRDILFFDKYNLEWDMKLADEVMNLTFQGMPIVRLGNDIPSTSNFVYRNPGPIYTPVMNTPSFTSFRPVPSTQRVSFLQNLDLDQWDRESCTDRVVIRQLECQSDHYLHHHYIHL